MAKYVRRNLNADGDYTINDFVEDKDVVLLAVKSRLQFFKGEWFLDTDDGTPYFQDIFVKPARLRLIEGILKRRILETPGIESFNKFELNFTKNDRNLIVNFEAVDEFGQTNSVEVTL